MNVISTSRLVAAFRTVMARVEAAFDASHVRRRVLKTWTVSVGDDPARVIAFSGITVIVAMVVALSLDLFVQRYPFPSRAELIVPGTVLVLAVVAVILRDPLARGWQDRRSR